MNDREADDLERDAIALIIATHERDEPALNAILRIYPGWDLLCLLTFVLARVAASFAAEVIRADRGLGYDDEISPGEVARLLRTCLSVPAES